MMRAARDQAPQLVSGAPIRPVVTLAIASQLAVASVQFEKLGVTSGGVDIGRWIIIAPGLVIVGWYLLAFSPNAVRAVTRGWSAFISLWLVWGATSILWSLDPRETAIAVVTYGSVVISAAWFVDRHGLTGFARLLAFSLTPTILVGIWWDLSEGFNRPIVEDRWQGLTYSPTALASLCVLIAIATVICVVEGGRLRVYAPIFVLAVVMLATSGSRNATAVLPIALAFIVVGRLSRRALMVVAVGGVVSLLLVGGAALQAGAGSFTSESQGRESVTSLNSRGEVWSAATDFIEQEPIVGYGWGSDQVVWAEAFLSGRITFEAGNAHNFVLEALLEGGVVGLMLLGLGVGGAAVRSLARRDAYSAALLFALIAHGMTEGLIERPSTQMAVLCAAVAASSVGRRVERGQAVSATAGGVFSSTGSPVVADSSAASRTRTT